ncbi:VOC family protein [Luteimonas fraxinea]|uniref:VOC family protein n=1 Tax=Luteimonas fraxinea TaxID=2901869 RepID=A0ABS8UBM8_9GAMM|nr:VOC family protein [Luteimonas fraxinea]MCD9096275.1 VOC family protein [Luteimonas fraxinea]MCD9125618.1 VOC family protein [Luteimonas fraxinea]UHH10347.1 VOC family protein [Luteimonas fraxinea]
MRILLNLDVDDLDRALAFYIAAFGLTPARRFGDDVVELLGADAPLYLLRKVAGSTGAGTTPRAYTRHWMPLHIDVVVDDLDVALAQALAAGAVQEGAIRDEAYGRIVQLADPFGHGWCLLAFSARGYDAIAT